MISTLNNPSARSLGDFLHIFSTFAFVNVEVSYIFLFYRITEVLDKSAPYESLSFPSKI